MNAQRAAQFALKLEQKKLDLQIISGKLANAGLTQHSSEATGGISKVRLHAADSGSETAAEEQDLQIVKNEVTEIRDIENAIAKIKAGTFGVCEDCGIQISEKRLEVLPEARLCIECQSLLEKDLIRRDIKRRPEREGDIYTNVPQIRLTNE